MNRGRAQRRLRVEDATACEMAGDDAGEEQHEGEEGTRKGMGTAGAVKAVERKKVAKAPVGRRYSRRMLKGSKLVEKGTRLQTNIAN